MNSATRYRPVCRLAAVVGSGLAAAAILPEIAGVGAPGLGGMQVSLLLGSLGFLAIAGMLGRVDGRILLLVVSSAFAGASLFLLASISNADLGWMLWQLRTKVVSNKPLEIHQSDPILGWKNRPGAIAVDTHYDYSVRYHINAHGHRENSSNPNTVNAPSLDDKKADAATILCLGGSFTFGQGVENDQAYPAVLDHLLPPNWHVVNAGVNGWGTVQSLLYLQQQLDDGFSPAMVTYGLIPAHLARNSDRESWLTILATSGRAKPVLAIENETPQFDRLVGIGQGSIDSDELDAEEVKITQRCILRMNQLCEQAGCQFYLLLLGDDTVPDLHENANASWMGRFAEKNGIQVIDLLDLPSDRFPHDGHPTVAWHRAAAERILRTISKEKVVDGK